MAAVNAIELDPLREADALQEAQLLDVKVSPLTSMCALLFDLRTSLQYEAGNASVLVVRGLREFGWCTAMARRTLTAFSVVSSVPSCSCGNFGLRLGHFPDGVVTLHGSSAEFAVVDIPSIGEVPPDYSDVESSANLLEYLPSWSSTCLLLQASIAN